MDNQSVPSERVLAVWSLMAVVVPLAAGRLGRGKSSVDRYFFGSCALLTFLFIGFVPRGTHASPPEGGVVRCDEWTATRIISPTADLRPQPSVSARLPGCACTTRRGLACRGRESDRLIGGWTS